MDYSYPVIFRCSECTLELSSIEALEVHVWNRHLRTFPYRCALCGYPSLSTKALAQHFHETHEPQHAIEFKRKIADELRLWEIVAQSIAVSLPMYDDDELYEEGPIIQLAEPESKQVWQMETSSESQELLIEGIEPSTSGKIWRPTSEQLREVSHSIGEIHEMDSMQRIHKIEPLGSMGSINGDSLQTLEEMVTIQQTLEDGTVVQLEERIDNVVMLDSSQQTTSLNDKNHLHDMNEEVAMHMNVVAEEVIEEDTLNELDNEEVFETMEHIVDNPGPSYVEEEIYDDADEQFLDVDEFIDEHGNTIVFEIGEYDSENKGGREMLHHLRIAKDQHIENTVRKVAHSRTRRRAPQIHTCEECGKVIKYPSKIAEHMRSHTGERPYKCHHPGCGLTFTQKGALKSHSRLHTGERPYACTWDCPRTFSSSSALKMHEKCHSGEKPYTCMFCGQLFGKRSHMIRHEKSQHPSLSAQSENHQLLGLEAAQEDEPNVRNAVLSVIDEVHSARLQKQQAKHGGIIKQH